LVLILLQFLSKQSDQGPLPTISAFTNYEGFFLQTRREQKKIIPFFFSFIPSFFSFLLSDFRIFFPTPPLENCEHPFGLDCKGGLSANNFIYENFNVGLLKKTFILFILGSLIFDIPVPSR